MDILGIIGVAFALSLDSYAASVSCGLNCKAFTWKVKLLIPLSFAAFQTVFPLIGYFFGAHLLPYIEMWDHWLAFAVLAIIGGLMIHGSFQSQEQKNITLSLRLILGMSIATSIDALATGFSLGLVQVNIWLTGLAIFVVTYAASAFGLMTGKRFQSGKIQKISAFIGGLILIAIGLNVLISHLT